MGNITVSSTTDSAEQVQQAAEYQPDENSNTGTVTTSSSTDDEQSVIESGETHDGELVASSPDTVPEKPPRVVSTDGPEEDKRIEDQMREDRLNEPFDYLGKSRVHKRISELVKQRGEARTQAEEARGEADRLRQQLAERQQSEQPRPAEPQSPQAIQT